MELQTHKYSMRTFHSREALEDTTAAESRPIVNYENT
jgi:hypothetical protein